MKDAELYERLLGLERPWRVQEVRLDLGRQEIEVEVVCEERAWTCPECGELADLHGRRTRRWRHLDSCQCKTIVVADVPRVKCSEHGTCTVQVPWAEGSSRFTMLFEKLAIDLLLATSTSRACELLRISWGQADRIKQRAVKRGLNRKGEALIRRLCIDEKSIGRGHQYLTIVLNADDPNGATIEYIGEDRTRECIDRYWGSRSREQLAAVEAVAMDLWAPYKHSTLAWVPNASTKIVHDPFHLMRHMNKAVDTVRRQEPVHRYLPKQLPGINLRHMWLYAEERLPKRYQQPLKHFRMRMPTTTRAWELKELLREFFRCRSLEDASTYFAQWYSRAIRSRIPAVKSVARMLKKHLPNILTFFKHRLTTAPSEAINSILAGLNKKACGYRNRERFKTDAFFHAGGLDLFPAILAHHKQ